MTNSAFSPVVDRVQELAAPIVEINDCELYDIEYTGGVVRVLVTSDSKEGLDLDKIAKLSRLIGRKLDEDDPIDGRYTLEVSSPGLERRLRTREHFIDAVGSEVSVKTAVPDGSQHVRGILVTVTPTEIHIRDEAGKVHEIAHDDVAKARTVFNWDKNPKK